MEDAEASRVVANAFDCTIIFDRITLQDKLFLSGKNWFKPANKEKT